MTWCLWLHSLDQKSRAWHHSFTNHHDTGWSEFQTRLVWNASFDSNVSQSWEITGWIKIRFDFILKNFSRNQTTWLWVERHGFQHWSARSSNSQQTFTAIGHDIRISHFGQEDTSIILQIRKTQLFAWRWEDVIQVWDLVPRHVIITGNRFILYWPRCSWLDLLFASDIEPANLRSFTLRAKRESRQLHHLRNVRILLSKVATT